MSSDVPQLKGFGAAPFDAFISGTASSAKGFEAVATETMDYSKKSFEKSRALYEKLIAVKTIDEAARLQSDFAKSAYEDFLAQAIKIGQIYSKLAQEAFKSAKIG